MGFKVTGYENTGEISNIPAEERVEEIEFVLEAETEAAAAKAAGSTPTEFGGAVPTPV